MFINKAVLLFIAALSAMAFEEDTLFAPTRELLRQGHYAEAAQELGRLEGRSALSDNERFEIGWLYGQAREFRRALAIFRSVPANIPDRVTRAFAEALADTQLQEFRAATGLLEPVQGEPSFGPKQANLLGVAYSKIGQADKAALLFRAQIQRQPSDPAAYLNLTTVLCENGKREACSQAALRTVKAFPTLAQAHLVLGAVRMEGGFEAESRAEFTEAHALDPGSSESAFFLALDRYKARDYAAAVQIIRATNASGARDADLYYLLAECLLNQDGAQQAEALDALDRAVTMNPSSVPARNLRGKLRFGKGEYKAAATDLEAALTQEPNSRTALYLLARTYQSLGRKKEAQVLRGRITSSADDAVAKMTAGRLTSAFSGDEAKQ